jgi:hypothetical protein
MRTGRLAVASALAVAGAAGLARAGPPPTEELALSIAGPRVAEISTWTDLRLDVANLGADPAHVHATVTPAFAAARPAAATGARCSGAGAIDCELSLGGGASATLTFPVRWDGFGSRTIEARARTESSPEAAASSTVSVYVLRLRGLRTTPTPVRAGQRLVAAATLARSDNGLPLSAHSLRCSAAVVAVPRGRPLTALRGRSTIRGAHLTCSWLVPASARGRYITVWMLADTHRGGMLTKYPFVRRVR